MKAAVVFGTFVLIACLYLQVDGAQYQGKIKDCNNPPEGIRNGCHRFRCRSGSYTVSTCGSSSVYCPEGQIADPGSEDLTKDYPKCCAEPFCRDLKPM